MPKSINLFKWLNNSEIVHTTMVICDNHIVFNIQKDARFEKYTMILIKCGQFLCVWLSRSYLITQNTQIKYINNNEYLHYFIPNENVSRLLVYLLLVLLLLLRCWSCLFLSVCMWLGFFWRSLKLKTTSNTWKMNGRTSERSIDRSAWYVDHVTW